MNIIIILLFAILTIVIIRKLLQTFPRVYFSISDLVMTTESSEINIRGYFLRFPILFIFTFVIALIFKGNKEYILLYSIFVPFLLIWPFILNEIIYDEKKLPKGKKKKYLFVYFLYSILCIISSLLSIPLYNLTSRDTPKWLNILYGRILDKYLSLDQLQQDVLFLIFTILVTIFISFFTMKKCRNYCDKNF